MVIVSGWASTGLSVPSASPCSDERMSPEGSRCLVSADSHWVAPSSPVAALFPSLCGERDRMAPLTPLLPRDGSRSPSPCCQVAAAMPSICLIRVPAVSSSAAAQGHARPLCARFPFPQRGRPPGVRLDAVCGVHPERCIIMKRFVIGPLRKPFPRHSALLSDARGLAVRYVAINLASVSAFRNYINSVTNGTPLAAGLSGRCRWSLSLLLCH